MVWAIVLLIAEWRRRGSNRESLLAVQHRDAGAAPFGLV
jgi:hypothetical protein